MNAYKQIYRHDPENGIYGDCYRTAIGCILNREPEKIPHFTEQCQLKTMGDSGKLAAAWLKDEGFSMVSFAFDLDPDGVLELMGEMNPDVYYILSGESKTGVNHCVIANGAKIIHDPSLDDSGIVGRCDDGLTWIEILVSNDYFR